MEQFQEQIDYLTKQYEQAYEKKNFHQCIQYLEQILSIKREVYGEDTTEFKSSAEKLCEVLNYSSMLDLQQDDTQKAMEQLKKAELLCKVTALQYRSTTYNNLACLYRKLGKYRAALQYLQSALDMEITLKNIPTLADTHLNLCAVLSQLNRHEEAIEHSLLAIVMLQDEFLQVTLKFFQMHKNNENVTQIQPKSLSEERLAVLGIAYHNLGVEFEHLKRYDESLKIYKKALNFAKENLGESHNLVGNLTKVVSGAEKQNADPQRVIKKIKRQKKILSVESSNRDHNLPRISKNHEPTISGNNNLQQINTIQQQNSFNLNSYGNNQQRQYSLPKQKNYNSDAQYIKLRTDQYNQQIPYRLEEIQQSQETPQTKKIKSKNQNSFRQNYQNKYLNNINNITQNYSPTNHHESYQIQQPQKKNKSHHINQSYDFNRPLQIQENQINQNNTFAPNTTKNLAQINKLQQKNQEFLMKSFNNENQYSHLLEGSDNPDIQQQQIIYSPQKMSRYPDDKGIQMQSIAKDSDEN